MLTSLERNVLVANRIAVILGILAFLLVFVLIYSFGVNINTPLIIGLGIFFFFIPLINRAGYVNFTRIVICAVPVVATFAAALMAKVFEKGFTDMLYYDSRFFLLIFAMIPCLIFDTREKWQLFSMLGLVFLALMLFDPVHEMLGVGYFQMGFTGKSYYYINFATMVTFVGITAGAITLKRAVEKTEAQNENYRLNLQETNQKLQESFNDIEAQNEEIIAQSEEISASQESLVEANRIIEKQNSALEIQIHQVNARLQEANEELVKHNNELQQFSYSISHNLRGPIARLLGLTNLVRFSADDGSKSENDEILEYIQTSAKDLDIVIRDLNEIVDIRNNLYQTREQVVFANEWRNVKHQLNITDRFESEHCRVDFSGAPSLFSVRPMIISIMLNLVSNAIKYRSPDRELLVNITTRKNQQYTILEVQDNGLGIDLELFQDDLFKMYKRFHDHREGKGLGLYLIKSQVDLLNGFVEIKSQPDSGTTFTIHLKNLVSAMEV